MDPYNKQVREFFTKTKHAGDLPGEPAGYFADHGMRVRLTAQCADGVMVSLRFRARGCPHVIAACEAFCREYEGREPAALEAFDSDRIMTDLAVPAEKTGRILVVEDAVRSLRAAIQDRESQPEGP